MKNKNKFFVGFVCLSMVSAGAAVNILAKNKSARAEHEGYTVHIESAPEGLVSTYTNVTPTYNTSGGNPIQFGFNDVKALESGVCTLSETGSISNQDKITGVVSVKVTFTGSLIVYGSLDIDSHFVSLGSLTSETTFNFDKSYDYIKIAAGAETNITDIIFDYTCSSRAVDEQTVRYEAEDVLVRCADWNYADCVWGNEQASGGQLVGNLWQGTTFHINHYSYFQGEYTLKVKYVNGTADQKVCYGVNGGKILLDVPSQVPGSWDWANASEVSVNVNLRKGWNDIVFGTIGAHAQYDYFEIENKGFRYDPADYEMKVTDKMFYAVEAEKIGDANRANDWNGPFFAGSGMGLTDNDANGLKLTFTNMKAGNYNFKLVYGNDATDGCGIKLQVNSNAVRNLTLDSSGGWNTLGNKTFQVTFVEGTNTITIMRNGEWCNFNAFFATIK